MRIAFVNQPWEVSSPPQQRGSLGLWSYHVARRLAREPGARVSVYEKPPAADAPPEVTAENVVYRRIPTSKADHWAQRLLPRLTRLRAPQRGYYLSKLYYSGYAARVARDLRDRGCDVVSIHNFSQFVPIIRAHNPRTKIVLHMNCDWLAQLDKVIVEERLAQSDLMLGCSDHVTEAAKRRFPHHAHKCRTVFNGVDTDWFVPGEGQRAPGKNVLFCGRVSPEKGVHDLLDAFERVVNEHPDARLEVLGPVGAAPKEFMVSVSSDPKVQALERFYGNGTDYEAELKKRMTPLVAERTTFTAHLPQPKVAERVRQADLLVLPSLTESFGMPLAEAMASGLPVVASRAGGMPELVDHEVTGLLVDSADPTALAAAISRLLADPDLRGAMGRQGRQRAVELFSWDQVAKSAIAAYGSVASGSLPARVPEAAVA